MDDSQAAGDIAHARRSEGWPTPLRSAPQLFTAVRLLGLSALWTRSVSSRQRGGGHLAALAAVSGEASWLQRKTTEVILVLFFPSSAEGLSD